MKNRIRGKQREQEGRGKIMKVGKEEDDLIKEGI